LRDTGLKGRGPFQPPKRLTRKKKGEANKKPQQRWGMTGK